MRRKLLAAAVATAVAAIALTGCSQRNAESGATALKVGDTIGVALPTKTSENVANYERYWQDALTKAGFKADIQYASNSNPVPDQQNQIQSMVTKGYKVIAISAQDGGQLGNQLAQAKKAGVTIIAWDRNIVSTENVDYYVSFNNFRVGQLQAQSLLEGLKKKNPNGPWNVELFAGAATTNLSTIFFNGAMSVLDPLIKSGQVVVPSGQTGFQQVATEGWLGQNAQTRMTNLITSTYAGGRKLDGVLSPNDTLARSIITALRQAGLSGQVVTGMDGDKASVPLIMDGTQYCTVYKDSGVEAQAAVDLISQLAQGKQPTVVADDKDNAWNGVKVVPAVLVPPVLVTKDNAAEAFQGNPELAALAKTNN
ncbi:substrate-binding domain-containing protein [Amycolatopsis viridis]|uniref:Multiple sugar transport system substrate-binding protein n=1 Tax=Amycolatopsis viridis TaxID=185678 RepID=A0ABX0STE7_9PSEU|nr:sugar-binding protein [Amycolatopsis viridis]NIH78884.1 putative multiple sugar transport system substrate-binding protein [Amycolatopsis viridis]